MPNVRFVDVSVIFGCPALLDRLTIQIEPGERVGIVVRNGTGKSNVLQLISRDLAERIRRPCTCCPGRNAKALRTRLDPLQSRRFRFAALAGALIAIGALLAYPPAALADGFFDMFFDNEDGSLDTSKYLKGGGILPVPIIITEPTVDNGLGVAGLYFHDPHSTKLPWEDDGAPSSGAHLEEEPPPGISGIAGAVTGNESWAVAGFHEGNWFNDGLRVRGVAGHASLNLAFYGDNANSEDDGVGYQVSGTFFQANPRLRIGKIPFFLGPAFQMLDYDLSFNNAANDSLPEFKGDATDLGLGVILQYDSRDNTLTPNRGYDTRVLYRRHDGALGSDFDYHRIEANNRAYWQLDDDATWYLAWRVSGTYTDDAPFFLQPFIDLRGIRAVRYQDNVLLQTDAEIRWQFHPRWSVLGFVGMGQVGDSVGDMFDSTIRPAGGGGLRYLLAREFGLHVGFDVAQGPEETIFYVQVGHAWARD